MSKNKQKKEKINNILSYEETIFEKFLKKSLFFLAMILIFVPLISFSNLLYPQVFSKMVIFYILIETILALFIVLNLINKRYRPSFYHINQDGKKKFDWISIFLGGYILFSLISAILSQDHSSAFFGTVGVSNGLITSIHFFALFIVLVSTFKEEFFWKWSIRLNILTGTLISFVALYQKFIKHKLAEGTFGNRGHLSGYLLFIIFLSAFLFLSKGKKWEKIISVFSGLIGLATLFFVTDIRGSQAGFIVAVITILTAYFLAHQKKIIRKMASGIILTIIIVGVIFAISSVSSGRVYDFFTRSNTVKTRVINWKIAFSGFLEKPVFGYGMENYHIVFEKHFSPEYYKNNFGGQSTEYGFALPHNKFAEVAVLGGIFGFLTYLGTFVFTFQLLYKRYFSTRDKSFLAIIGMWSAYLIHLFFLFDNIVSFFMFFSLLAFTSFILKENDEEKKDEKIKLNSKLIYIIGGFIFLGTAWALVYFSFQPLFANISASSALIQSRAGRYDATISSVDKIKNKNVFNILEEILFQLGRESEIKFIYKENLKDADKEYIKQLAERKDKALENNPNHLYHNINLSRLHFILGDYKKSNEMLERMIDAKSKRMEVYMFSGENYIALGENDKAVEMGEKGLSLDPTYGFSNYRLAVIYKRIGDYDKTVHQIDEAIKNGYKDKNLYDFYADTVYSKKDYKRAIIAFSRIAELSPENPQTLANLTMVYFEAKDYVKARETAEKLVKKFPKIESQIRPFIDKIPKQ